MITRIAILGDFNPAFPTHLALNDSVRQVVEYFDRKIAFEWIATDIFDLRTAFNVYTGVWIAPGSPYKNMETVVNAITYARTNSIPAFGNCGGFQHMIIEFARNVCNITDAGHEETDPDSKQLLISKLSCSLIEQEEQLTVVDDRSLLFSIVKNEKFRGKYFCNYGLNMSYIDILKANGLRPTSISSDGQVRSFELDDHPFFVGTLFQPALTSTIDEPNPLILEFIRRSISLTDLREGVR